MSVYVCSPHTHTLSPPPYSLSLTHTQAYTLLTWEHLSPSLSSYSLTSPSALFQTLTHIRTLTAGHHAKKVKDFPDEGVRFELEMLVCTYIHTHTHTQLVNVCVHVYM